MRIFVLKARKGPTRSAKLRSDLGTKSHTEVIIHSILNAFFLSKSMRRDVVFHVVLESSEDFSRTITFDSREALAFEGFHEEAVIKLIEAALKKSEKLKKDCTAEVAPGLRVSTQSFEKLVKELAEQYPIYLLDRKGEDLRNGSFSEDVVFIFTDHIPFPKKLAKYLVRLGAQKLSLGPQMLFTAHCVVLLHNELDRKE